MAYRGRRDWWLLVVLLLAWGIIGGFVGVLLQPVAPWAGKILLSLGASSFTLDLLVLTLTFGLVLKLNLGSIVGFVLAMLIYFRM